MKKHFGGAKPRRLSHAQDAGVDMGGNLFAKSPSEVGNFPDVTNPKENESNSRGPPYSPPQSPKNDNDAVMMNFSDAI